MKDVEQIAKDCVMDHRSHDIFIDAMIGRMPTKLDKLYVPVVQNLAHRIVKLEAEIHRRWTIDCEDIFIVSVPRKGGRWNKIVKSQERWWYSAKEAQAWLDKQEDWFQDSNKVFKARMSLDQIERVTT